MTETTTPYCSNASVNYTSLVKVSVCKSCTIPCRFWIACMAFAATAVLYVIQSNMSLTILAMVKSDTDQQPDYGPRYAYTAYQQNALIGGYYIGATVATFPLGLLVDRYNCVRIYTICCSLLCALLVAVIPLIAWSFTLMLAVRITIGFAQGAIYPAMHKLFSRWAPPGEMGKFTAALMGSNIGTICSWTLSGLMIDAFGWHYSFYMASLVALVFCVFWWFLVYDTPARHPRISVAERQYIQDSRNDDIGKSSWVPLKAMLTSIPVLMLVILHYANLWGFLFVVNCAPRFINEYLGQTLLSTGFLASVPYVVRFLSSFLFAIASDYIRQENWMSLMNLRRLFCVFSHIIPGILLIILPYAGTDLYACVALISLSFGFNGAITQSVHTNIHDLTPNFAATLLSIANAIGSTCGFAAPLVVAFFTADNNTFEGWRNVFLLGAAIYIIPALLFMCFGSSDRQPWNSFKKTYSAEHIQIPLENINFCDNVQ